MPTTDELRSRFAIPGVVDVRAGDGGLPVVVVTTPEASAEVYLHGAHVLAFAPAGAGAVLFRSAKSHFQAGKAIRGGVPIIFPWFGPNAADPALPAHGFARTLPWELAGIFRSAGGVTAELRLGPSDATRKLWPHEFAAVYRVTVGPTLGLSLTVRNTGAASFTFEEALHTYLAVTDVRRVGVEGLAGREYLDQLQSRKLLTQGPEPITFAAETDRVYVNTPDEVVVRDPAGGRVLRVGKSGSASTVVWNPWVAKAKAMSDFGDDEWPSMVCIETANAAENRVTLAPGAEHEMTATLSAADL